MQGLTEKQAAVLDYIRESAAEKRYPPSVREIMAHFGFKSPYAALGHIRALVRKGVLRQEPNKNRSLVVVDDADPCPASESTLMRERDALLAALHAARELVKAEGDTRWGWQRRLDGILCEAIERAEGPGVAG